MAPVGGLEGRQRSAAARAPGPGPEPVSDGTADAIPDGVRQVLAAQFLVEPERDLANVGDLVKLLLEAA